MIPNYRLTVAGLDVTEQVRDRLVSLTVVDEAGQISDTCEIVLDDRDALLPAPPDNAGVAVELGYNDGPLVGLGDFIVDEVEFASPPRGMVLKCVSTAKAAESAAGTAAGAYGSAGQAKGLLGYIYAREGGYESFNRGTAGDSPGGFPGGLTSRSIGDVISLQRQGQVFAVGAAQFTPGVLDQAMRDAGLTPADQFSPANQDRMATALLTGRKRPALAAYLKGSSDNITAAHQDLCQEFAGVVCPNGRGFFDGRAGNRGSGSVAEVQAALKQARDNIANSKAADAAAAVSHPEGSPIIASGQRELLKDRHTESWHNTTLGQVFTTIAKRHKLEPVITTDAADEVIEHEDQTNESDQAFLTRLAERFDAVVKPKQGQLLLAKRDDGSMFSASTTLIRNDETTTWRARLKDRARYSAVTARWIDRKSSTEKVVEHRSGQGFPTFQLQKTYRSEQAAEKAAAAKSAALAAATVEITITRVGTPKIPAESRVILEGFRPEIDGKPWVVNRVQHILDEGGYRTTIECGTPRENRSLEGPGGGSGNLGILPGGPVSEGSYIQGNIGPTSTGPHFDIKRADGAYFDRGALDQFVIVNGQPLSRGVTVPGGEFGASRSYGKHNGWDYAFGGGARLQLRNGAQWVGNVPGTAHGDKASFRTPDGTTYSILHGRFQPGPQ